MDSMTLPGDGYIRWDFHHVIAFLALRHRNEQVFLCMHLPLHILATVLYIYGMVKQTEISRNHTWFKVDYSPDIDNDQQDGHSFIHYSLVTWFASTMFVLRTMQFIHCDIISDTRNIANRLTIHKLLVVNAAIVAIIINTLEINAVCTVTGDWNAFLYLMLSSFSRLLFEICQGHMYLSGIRTEAYTHNSVYLAGHMYLSGIRTEAYTRREQLSLILTCIANIIIPVTNALNLYTYWTSIFPITGVTIVLLAIDIVYRLALLNRYMYLYGANVSETAPVPQTVTDHRDPPEEVDILVPVMQPLHVMQAVNDCDAPDIVSVFATQTVNDCDAPELKVIHVLVPVTRNVPKIVLEVIHVLVPVTQNVSKIVSVPMTSTQTINDRDVPRYINTPVTFNNNYVQNTNDLIEKDPTVSLVGGL